MSHLGQLLFLAEGFPNIDNDASCPTTHSSEFRNN